MIIEKEENKRTQWRATRSCPKSMISYVRYYQYKKELCRIQDSLVHPCRFKSCCPHHTAKTVFGFQNGSEDFYLLGLKNRKQSAYGLTPIWYRDNSNLICFFQQKSLIAFLPFNDGSLCPFSQRFTIATSIFIDLLRFSKCKEQRNLFQGKTFDFDFTF